MALTSGLIQDRDRVVALTRAYNGWLHDRERTDLSEEVKRKMLHDNALRLYRL